MAGHGSSCGTLALHQILKGDERHVSNARNTKRERALVIVKHLGVFQIKQRPIRASQSCLSRRGYYKSWRLPRKQINSDTKCKTSRVEPLLALWDSNTPLGTTLITHYSSVDSKKPSKSHVSQTQEGWGQEQYLPYVQLCIQRPPSLVAKDLDYWEVYLHVITEYGHRQVAAATVVLWSRQTTRTTGAATRPPARCSGFHHPSRLRRRRRRPLDGPKKKEAGYPVWPRCLRQPRCRRPLPHFSLGSPRAASREEERATSFQAQ